jgi:hypothetical protein
MAGGMVGDVMTEYQEARFVEMESISSRLVQISRPLRSEPCK